MPSDEEDLVIKAGISADPDTRFCAEYFWDRSAENSDQQSLWRLLRPKNADRFPEPSGHSPLRNLT